VTVRYVYPESPAAKADLRAGDAIVSAGDKPVADAAALRKLLGSYAPGDKLRLGVRRGQQKLDVEALLGALPEGLPPADLPPAHPPAGPAEKQPPRVGKITGKQAGLSGDAVVYVPEGYSAAIGCGVVVYLAGRHAPKPDELVAQWKPLCDRHELILVAPKPKDPNRWEASELRVAPRLVLELRKSYMIDPSRVALYAGSGGWNCFQLGLSARSVFRGLVALDAVLRGAPPACDPTQPLAIYLARSGSRSPAAAERVAAALRGQKYPVTVKQLAPPPGPLAPEDLAEIARWIDALDRI
jgi:hypothetical protein